MQDSVYNEIVLVSVLGTPATTEQLRQWIVANRRSLPDSVGEGDLAQTILRCASLFNFTQSKIEIGAKLYGSQKKGFRLGASFPT